MSWGITIIVVFLVAIFVLGFPTRRRAQRAYLPKPGPHPLARPFRALGRWRRQRSLRKRRRHLRKV